VRQSDTAGGKRSLRSSLPDKSRAVLCNSPEDQRLDSFFPGRGGPLISAGANRESSSAYSNSFTHRAIPLIAELRSQRSFWCGSLLKFAHAAIAHVSTLRSDKQTYWPRTPARQRTRAGVRSLRRKSRVKEHRP